MKIAVHTANLGNFDRVQRPVGQSLHHDWHCFTDKDFPPIAGLTPRLQYRIPKTHAWQMKPGYDYYVWLDGSVTLAPKDSLQWLINQLGNHDMVLFEHPDRSTVQEEVTYLEEKKEHPYIKSRYANGLHREQLATIKESEYIDKVLYASTILAYRPIDAVKKMMEEWLYTSVRYFTCDQVALPYLLWKHGVQVAEIHLDPFKNPFTTLVSRHE
jgi:hypothetical protein